MTTLTIATIIVAVISILICAESGLLGWSIVCLAVFAAVIIYVEKMVIPLTDIEQFFTMHIGAIVWLGTIYIISGAGWSILKWKWYCEEKYRKWEHAIIKASDNKARITGWMIWWPISLTWFLIHDPITRFYNYLYRKMVHIFDSISTSTREKVMANKAKNV